MRQCQGTKKVTKMIEAKEQCSLPAALDYVHHFSPGLTDLGFAILP
ncbi:MAG: hypothetical protein ACO31I_16260 [Prochlorotrichaceae cyanobacterium]|jgi:hypothetical protein